MGSPSLKQRNAADELLELDSVKVAAMALHEALNQKHFTKFPSHVAAWVTYRRYYSLLMYSRIAVVTLLLLTFFEAPLWCKEGSHSIAMWEFRSPIAMCAGKKHGPPIDELSMSGMPFLPLGYGLFIEYIMLIIITVRVFLSAKLHGYFKDIGVVYMSNAHMMLDYSMIVLGFSDLFYISFFPSANVRIAPFVRFGLAISIPWIRTVVVSFARVVRAVVSIGLFLVGTVLIWAWIGAMVFDDMTEKDKYGTPINQGFENFGKSAYTMFSTMTTATVPDAMTVSFSHNKALIFFWIPFVFLACCIFSQVILATVYNEYGDQVAEGLKAGHKHRVNGVKVAFHYLKSTLRQTKGGKQEDLVHYETFKQLANTMREFDPHIPGEELIHICFKALDDDKNEMLTLSEFDEFCVLLQTKFAVTTRDSEVRKKLEGTPAGETLKWWMTNGEDGPDFGCLPPPMMTSLFEGSPFDKLISSILALNVCWLVVESLYDLNDIPEPSLFLALDFWFTFAYVLEVMVKLSWWSWPEYWKNRGNRFDFFTTVVLAMAGFAYLCFNISHDLMRYLNLLRLVRLLKAMNSIDEFAQTVKTISTMVTTCGDVFAMNMLVIYFWSAAGVQLFGGQLFSSNPVFEGHELDFFQQHQDVYNFNDMVLAMVTMFVVTITAWNDAFYAVCVALYEPYSLGWSVSQLFWLSFYLGSPLIAFNVVSAFSIDVFCKLRELQDTEEVDTRTNIERNLEKVRVEMAGRGLTLLIRESAVLKRERVYREMFEQIKDASEASEEAGEE